MNDLPPQVQTLIAGLRAEAERRYARWDNAIFGQYTSWQVRFLWRSLEKQSTSVRERTLRSYLNLAVAGIGAGLLTGPQGEPQTLLEALLGRMPYWLMNTAPGKHAEIAAAAWNLATGARREALWMEQYLLARADEFEAPLTLEQTARELLTPVLEPQPDAAWKGAFAVTMADIAQKLPDFLPGELAMITPRLIRADDRRTNESAGVLLLPGGKSECIGKMARATPATAPPPLPAGLAVSWASDRVTAGGIAADLPLMACEPLHTLALPGGYLIAAVQNSQRLWIADTP